MSNTNKKQNPKNFFPNSDDILNSTNDEIIANINSNKSELANYVLNEIKKYKDFNKSIEIPLDEISHTRNERDVIKRMLFDAKWDVINIVNHYALPGLEYEIKDVSISWKIQKLNYKKQ